MTFKTNMAIDAVKLTSTSIFGETVTYTPHGASAVSIQAVVERNPLQVESHGGENAATKRIELTIPNDATVGRTAIKERFDKVALKYSLDDAANTTFVITKIMDHDEGAWKVEAIG